MKRKYGWTGLFTAGILTAVLLSGCGQKSSSDAETEALKEQVARLEQQISQLEQQAQEDHNVQEDASGEVISRQDKPAASEGESEGGGISGTSDLKTTDTMESLEALVAAFEEKADSAAADGSDSENMEKFFSLKQEEKQIDDKLDLHEDELEYLYRKQALSREDYNKMDLQLERLEDRLEDAEDYLELVFGIDD